MTDAYKASMRGELYQLVGRGFMFDFDIGEAFGASPEEVREKLDKNMERFPRKSVLTHKGHYVFNGAAVTLLSLLFDTEKAKNATMQIVESLETSREPKPTLSFEIKFSRDYATYPKKEITE